MSLTRFTAGGAYQWTLAFGGNSNDWCYDMTMDRATGDLYMSGNFSGSCNFDPGPGSDIHTGDKAAFLCKFRPE